MGYIVVPIATVGVEQNIHTLCTVSMPNWISTRCARQLPLFVPVLPWKRSIVHYYFDNAMALMSKSVVPEQRWAQINCQLELWHTQMRKSNTKAS